MTSTAVNAATHASLKLATPNRVILLRLPGNRFHTYGEDAVLLSEVLDLPYDETDPETPLELEAADVALFRTIFNILIL